LAKEVGEEAIFFGHAGLRHGQLAAQERIANK